MAELDGQGRGDGSQDKADGDQPPERFSTPAPDADQPPGQQRRERQVELPAMAGAVAAPRVTGLEQEAQAKCAAVSAPEVRGDLARGIGLAEDADLGEARRQRVWGLEGA